MYMKYSKRCVTYTSEQHTFAQAQTSEKEMIDSTCCIFLFKNNLFAYNWNDAKLIHL